MDENPVVSQNMHLPPDAVPPMPEASRPQASKTMVDRAIKAPPTRSGSDPKPEDENEKLGMLMDVNLQITVELGRTRLTVKEVLELQKGSVIELNRTAGEPVDIYVNEHLLARGEVVVVDDKFGVRITEILGKGNPGEVN
jgi:flagellar motor switch protein FliN